MGVMAKSSLSPKSVDINGIAHRMCEGAETQAKRKEDLEVTNIYENTAARSWSLQQAKYH